MPLEKVTFQDLLIIAVVLTVKHKRLVYAVIFYKLVILLQWTVNGKLRVGFFALCDISVGDELTFDYQFQRFGESAQKCHCGSENCRGYLGVAKQTDSIRSDLYISPLVKGGRKSKVRGNDADSIVSLK